MLVQVITGRATDAGALKRQSDRWQAELRPGATGFLGSTSGIGDDGRFVTLARFESAGAARRNSERPEQGAWWAETERCVDDVEFHDCGNVATVLGGGSDEAGFVQVMMGRVKDASALDRQLASGDIERLRPFRPEILGGLLARDEAGSFAYAVYFTSEAAAREGEKQEPPAELRAFLEAWMDAVDVEHYIDLHDPWLY